MRTFPRQGSWWQSARCWSHERSLLWSLPVLDSCYSWPWCPRLPLPLLSLYSDCPRRNDQHQWNKTWSHILTDCSPSCQLWLVFHSEEASHHHHRSCFQILSWTWIFKSISKANMVASYCLLADFLWARSLCSLCHRFRPVKSNSCSGLLYGSTSAKPGLAKINVVNKVRDDIDSAAMLQ